MSHLVGNYRTDFIIDNRIILEIKATRHIGDVQYHQMIHYLKATKLQLGLLINFGEEKVVIKRIINTSSENIS